MVYLFVLFVYLSAVSADICFDLGCPPCVGASGICCGQGNLTDPITGETNQTWCSSICLPEGYTCCGCNTRFSTDRDIACFGCGGVIGGIQQYCVSATSVNASPNQILDYFCTDAMTHMPNLALLLFLVISSLFLLP